MFDRKDGTRDVVEHAGDVRAVDGDAAQGIGGRNDRDSLGLKTLDDARQLELSAKAPCTSTTVSGEEVACCDMSALLDHRRSSSSSFGWKPTRNGRISVRCRRCRSC
jgi:hypothetical protein